VLCPSLGDPERNRNRLGGMWSVPTVGAILANPRYTGREVWNRRQATDRTGRSTVVGECVVSKAVTHPALVSEADFVAAQRVRAERAIGDGGRRRYLLRGLLRCGHRGRRMGSHWVHERAEYRCRHGHRGTASRPVDAPDNLYVREDAMLRGLAVRVTLDDRDAAGATSPQDPPSSCAQTLWWWRSTARPDGLSPLATDGHCLGYRRAFPDPGTRWGNSVSEGLAHWPHVSLCHEQRNRHGRSGLVAERAAAAGVPADAPLAFADPRHR
jgi:hypothetical protein